MNMLQQVRGAPLSQQAPLRLCDLQSPALSRLPWPPGGRLVPAGVPLGRSLFAQPCAGTDLCPEGPSAEALEPACRSSPVRRGHLVTPSTPGPPAPRNFLSAGSPGFSPSSRTPQRASSAHALPLKPWLSIVSSVTTAALWPRVSLWVPSWACTWRSEPGPSRCQKVGVCGTVWATSSAGSPRRPFPSLSCLRRL